MKKAEYVKAKNTEDGTPHTIPPGFLRVSAALLEHVDSFKWADPAVQGKQRSIFAPGSKYFPGLVIVSGLMSLRKHFETGEEKKEEKDEVVIDSEEDEEKEGFVVHPLALQALFKQVPYGPNELDENEEEHEVKVVGTGAPWYDLPLLHLSPSD